MRNFYRLAENVPMLTLQHQLAKAKHLWNENKFRTTYQGTPHVDVDDIWVRFSSLEKCYPKDAGEEGLTNEVMEDTGAVWYPAKEALSEIRDLSLNIGRLVNGYSLERVLITRIKPGGQILPHADTGGAYVQLPDISRYHAVIQGAPGSWFRCGQEKVQMLTGEVWWFDAGEEHEVLNSSEMDRIHLIVDWRCW